MRDGDAGNQLESIPQSRRQFVYIALAILSVNQPDIHIGVDFSLGVTRVNGGQRVPNFRKPANDAFHLLCFGFGYFQG